MSCLRASLAVAALLAAQPVRAEPPPEPPCAGAVVPAWPVAGAGPTVAVWHAADLPEQWQPAACSGLTRVPGATFVAVSGIIGHEGNAATILARLGAVSRQLDVRYWDVGGLDWSPLLVDASALSGPDPQQRRPDFTPEEMHAGARLYTVYDDDQSPGPVVIEIEIREAGPDGFLTVARNVTDLRLMGMSIAAPGDLAAMTWVRRAGPDSFEYHALPAMALNRLAAALTSDSAHVNRAVASYRYLAGMRTDRDPPAALK